MAFLAFKKTFRAMELQNFETKPGFNLESHAYCDVIFHRPTVIIKLDAAINMYHHFCDFVNLFATQFLNNTYFGRDIDILWWDTVSSSWRNRRYICIF